MTTNGEIIAAASQLPNLFISQLVACRICSIRLAISQRRHNIQLNVIVANSRAGTKFQPITNLIAKRIKGIGRTEALGAASHAFAFRHEPIAARFHCYVKFHNKPNLRPGIDVVNYPAAS
jgi:hypothetical protein